DVGSGYVALAAGGVLALIAVLALALALRSRRRGANTVAAPRSSRFCTHCGATARPGDRFCHRCGTAIR
ncbi:MAG: zinc-ribbon domain-containing protein, partial [Acidobacteria bacterium]|nr:zinc-ribbon domain-containing protein [Acidobacteriota bacterium]